MRIKKIAILEFKFPVDFKNGYLAETRYPLEDEPLVMITDIDKDWQAPIEGTINIGNPKIKRMTKEKFKDTFKITHIRETGNYYI